MLSNGNFAPVEESGRITFDLAAQSTIVENKYQVLSLIGEGGMGAIYKVHHMQLRKDMALKTFASRNLSSESWHRFQREAQSIAKLKHKNIVEVFDFGIIQNELPYYTMTLLKGESLAERIAREGPLTPERALQVFLQAAEALAHAHRHNIVHRDIKPGNIFLEDDAAAQRARSDVKIVDFGIAKLAENAGAAGDQSLTQVGTIFGSPLYMSPEQSLGLEVDQRSDIYSFGCALFEALTGAPPFYGETALATILCHQNKKPARLSDTMGGVVLPQRLDNLLAKLLEKRPDERYQTFSLVSSDIKFCLEDLAKKGERAQLNAAEAEAELSQESAAGGAPSSMALLKIIIICGVAIAAAALLVLAYPALDAIIHPRGVVASKFTAVVPENKTIVPTVPERDQAAADQQPFCLMNQGNMRVFKFPRYGDMGYFSLGGEMTDRLPCKGQVVVSTGKTIFHAGAEFLNEPKLFKRFRRGDIVGVALDSTGDGWSAKDLPYFDHLNDISVLVISKGDFDGRIMKELEKFQRLTHLDVSYTEISGRDLAASSLVRHLDSLTASEIIGMPEFFRAAAALGDKCHIKDMRLKNCKLTDADLKEVAKIKSLVSLGLRQNNISGSGLSYLATLPQLRYLELRDNKIEKKYFDSFSAFPLLHQLDFTDVALSPADRERLSRGKGHTIKVVYCKPDTALENLGPLPDYH